MLYEIPMHTGNRPPLWERGIGSIPVRLTDGTAAETFQGYEIDVAAKTGSAQTGREAANGVFVCYAPFDEPEIAVAVVVEKGGSGSALATIAKQVMDYYFTYSNNISEDNNENTLIR